MLILRDNKPDFSLLFKSYMTEYEALEKSYIRNSYGYDSFFDDDYDDYYNFYGHDFDFGSKFNSKRARRLLDDYQSSFSVRSSSKRGKRGNKHKSKCIPLYPNGRSTKKRYSDTKSNMFDSRGDDKIIYFYDDIDNPEDNSTIFYNVFDFDKFLDEEGIQVDDKDINKLLSRSVSHCCINPASKLNGELLLMTDTSYGSLRWQCAESNDELEYSNSKKK